MMSQKNKLCLLDGFGISELSEEMFQAAETFLINCIDKSKSKNFDELRMIIYNTYSKKLDLNKMPCSSIALREHIKRAYIQTNLWITSTERSRQIIEDRASYGWTLSVTTLVPTLLPQGLLARPANLPEPCRCKKCVYETKCPHRKHKMKCCRYCVCWKEKQCKIHISYLLIVIVIHVEFGRCFTLLK